jgi:hypothetical protein
MAKKNNGENNNNENNNEIIIIIISTLYISLPVPSSAFTGIAGSLVLMVFGWLVVNWRLTGILGR